ncbi:MAG: lysine--tRNA ligase [Actinomycetota bacterium]
MPEEAAGRERDELDARRARLEHLRERGVEPFALSYSPDSTAVELHRRYEGLGPETTTDDEIAVAGRIVLARRFGKLAFFTLRDGTGDIQLFCLKEFLGDDAFELLEDLDLGDIVGARGVVMTTKKGELSVRVAELTLLTKSLRPLPEKWHGLRDEDLQQRLRYLQLASDPESRSFVEARAGTLRTIRGYLDGRGFVEVETPVLQPVAGGALAKPFTTHHDALDADLKLRISLELYLKRLLVGGIERIYEIGRTFRNEGLGTKYSPEFTMLEAYQAYGDYSDMMRLAEDVVRESARAVRGTLRIPFRGRELDLEPAFRRITVLGSVSEKLGEEIELDRTDLPAIAEKNDVHVDPAWGPGKIAQELFEKLVEETLFEPTFVMDFPQEVSPLARPHRDNPALTEHFDLVIGGIELATAFSELTDPDDQRRRFEAQARAKTQGDEEAHPLDEDFLRALEHGMPPAGGIGIGIDRLLIVLTDAPSIRDVVSFPQLRPQEG